MDGTPWLLLIQLLKVRHDLRENEVGELYADTSEIVELVIRAFTEDVTTELKRVGEDVRKIIQESFQSGLEFLNDAKHMRNPDLGRQKIYDAIAKFTEASKIDQPLTAIKAERFVGVCYDLLEENLNALRWYEKAYTSAYNLEQKLIKDADYSGGRFIVDILLGFSIVGLPVAHYRDKAHEKKAKSADVLRNEVYSVMRPLSDLLYGLHSTLSTLRPSSTIIDVDVTARYASSDTDATWSQMIP